MAHRVQRGARNTGRARGTGTAGKLCSPAVDVRQAHLARALELLRALFKSLEPTTATANTTVTPPLPLTPRPVSQPDPADVTTPDLPLDLPVEKVPGINRSAAQAFKRLKLHTVADLLYHFPHRYDDYTSQQCIANLRVGAVETIVGTVCDVRTFRTKTGRDGVEIQVEDPGGRLRVVFFGARWLAQQFKIGRKLVLSGKVTSYQGLCQMTGPDWEPYAADELIHTGRLVPVHPLTKGLHERNARKILKQVVDQAAPLVPEYLPPVVRERTGLLPLGTAIAQMHFPDNQEMLARARERLGFDEFLFIQLGVIQRRQLWQGEMGYAFTWHAEVHADLLQQLPFALTGAQQRALTEIFADVQRPVPMARLLQGDVGSGKTVVAAAVLLQAIANGLQGALMAPTEILAEQHYKALRQLLSRVRVPRDMRRTADTDDTDWKGTTDADHLARLDAIKRLLGIVPEDDLDGAGVRVALLTGSLGTRDRRRVLEAIANGDVDLVIGTHA